MTVQHKALVFNRQRNKFPVHECVVNFNNILIISKCIEYIEFTPGRREGRLLRVIKAETDGQVRCLSRP